VPNWDRVCTNCGFEGCDLDFVTPRSSSDVLFVGGWLRACAQQIAGFSIEPPTRHEDESSVRFVLAETAGAGRRCEVRVTGLVDRRPDPASQRCERQAGCGQTVRYRKEEEG
jgi:hypothetical protein